MNTLELKDHALDYVLALIEGYSPGSETKNVEIRTDDEGKVSCILVSINGEYVAWSPTTGSQGDAIIDRESISVIRCDDEYGTDSRGFCNNVRIPVWAATLGQHSADDSYGSQGDYWGRSFSIDIDEVVSGSNRREAAMRKFVVHKLGRTVEIPEQLR